MRFDKDALQIYMHQGYKHITHLLSNRPMQATIYIHIIEQQVKVLCTYVYITQN